MNLSEINVAWTIITLVGSFASLRILREMILDHRAIDGSQTSYEHRRKLLASRMAISGELARGTVQIFFCLLGFNAIFGFIGPNLRNLLVGLFIAVALLLMVTSLVDNFYRRQILETAEKED